MLKNIKDKTKPKALKIHLNEKNVVHLVPLSDNLQLVYGVDFSQGTDQSLARVFLQELKEAKNHVKNCIAGNVYCELAETPKNIMDIDSPKNYTNGLVVFNLFVNNSLIFLSSILFSLLFISSLFSFSILISSLILLLFFIFSNS